MRLYTFCHVIFWTSVYILMQIVRKLCFLWFWGMTSSGANKITWSFFIFFITVSYLEHRNCNKNMWSVGYWKYGCQKYLKPWKILNFRRKYLIYCLRNSKFFIGFKYFRQSYFQYWWLKKNFFGKWFYIDKSYILPKNKENLSQLVYRSSNFAWFLKAVASRRNNTWSSDMTECICHLIGHKYSQFQTLSCHFVKKNLKII